MLTETTNHELQLLIVGDYLFEARVGLLSGPSGAHHICSRMTELLCSLIEHSGEVVQRDDLICEIWKDEPEASQALNQCVARLRHYFQDTAKAANYIQTIPNEGYRLVTPVYGSTRKPVHVHPLAGTRQYTGAGSSFYRLMQEFRQRKVCRAMLLYTIVVWAIFQVSEIVVPALRMPDWVNSLVVVLGLMGFPIAAILAWVFDLTPSGLVKDAPIESQAPANTGRWGTLAVDSALLSVALVICGMLVFSSFS
ncbi:MAG: winged helix-turn-helix domain-containing protein [Xanthomonadales bacterium]|nr:winged helix-turn-helix domain-containing protein [Gammaproteobacteria bacterium]MBT8055042.1 winged helix-turn-helix domain-containing protein [Gammaproteobacteria bacterium]NND57039.1 winged helix-turn-helix domain-containing protein [Xanthomonadales bacterium]